MLLLNQWSSLPSTALWVTTASLKKWTGSRLLWLRKKRLLNLLLGAATRIDNTRSTITVSLITVSTTNSYTLLMKEERNLSKHFQIAKINPIRKMTTKEETICLQRWNHRQETFTRKVQARRETNLSLSPLTSHLKTTKRWNEEYSLRSLRSDRLTNYCRTTQTMRELQVGISHCISKNNIWSTEWPVEKTTRDNRLRKSWTNLALKMMWCLLQALAIQAHRLHPQLMILIHTHLTIHLL